MPGDDLCVGPFKTWVPQGSPLAMSATPGEPCSCNYCAAPASAGGLCKRHRAGIDRHEAAKTRDAGRNAIDAEVDALLAELDLTATMPRRGKTNAVANPVVRAASYPDYVLISSAQLVPLLKAALGRTSA